jgi:hypothetical protein
MTKKKKLNNNLVIIQVLCGFFDRIPEIGFIVREMQGIGRLLTRYCWKFRGVC